MSKNKVFLDNLPRRGKLIDWKNSIGMSVKYKYKDIEDYFKILSYDSPNNMLTIEINNQIAQCATNQLKRCPFGYILGFRTQEYKFEVGDVFNNMEILEQKRIKRGLNRHGKPRLDKGYKYKCLICGGIAEILEYQLAREIQCPICCNRIIVKGINDIATTHPRLAEYFLDIEDAYTCSYSSPAKFNMACIRCGYKKSMSPNTLSRNGFGCQICSDSVSFPEKFLTSVLMQSNINFERDKSFDWSEGRRYDFYIPSINCIIETHGNQHYKDILHYGRTLEEEQDNDNFKYDIAIRNNVKNYIVLDCRESSLKWIKKSIKNSLLPKLININSVDWNICERVAMGSLIEDVCELYNKGTARTIELASIFRISQGTVINYLHKGSKIGLCHYNPIPQRILFRKPKRTRNGFLVKVFNSKSECMGTFNSVPELEKLSLDVFGEKLLSTGIYEVCRGEKESYKGYTFEYVKDPLYKKDIYENNWMGLQIFSQNYIIKVFKNNQWSEVKSLQKGDIFMLYDDERQAILDKNQDRIWIVVTDWYNKYSSKVIEVVTYGKPYKDMTKEEKDVIDSFQGREKYEKVIQDKNFYLSSTSNLLAITG